MRCITDEQSRFFLQNGYLIIPGVIGPVELERLRRETDQLVEFGCAEVRSDPDFAYGEGHQTGRKVLRRVEYVVDKSDACKSLLGHPFVLASVEKLMGPDFIPTWDSMVVKLPGEGIAVPWHRDAGTDMVGDRPIFNVDFYLDEADEDTCVWVVPGSHLWSAEAAAEWLSRRRPVDQTKEDFKRTGAVPALMQPGDVMLHNILALHGSPANRSPKLRRVIYYEFRTAHVEEQLGPHVSEYIPLKQEVLKRCIERRSQDPLLGVSDPPFAYRPPAPYNTVSRVAEELPTYRYVHSEYWRS